MLRNIAHWSKSRHSDAIVYDYNIVYRTGVKNQAADDF